MRKSSEYIKILHIFEEIHSLYPSYNLGRHIATMLDDCGDVWGTTDKELLFVLQKYKAQLEMDVPHTEGSELDKIIRDGMNLDIMFKEEEEEY